MKQEGTDLSSCWTISFASNGPEGIKTPLQSTTQPVLYCPAKLFPSLTAMQAHTTTTSRSKGAAGKSNRLGAPAHFHLTLSLEYREAQLCYQIRKGRMIKAAKQLSKRVILSSVPAWALSMELLFRNFTKRKSESYFGCRAEKTSTFPEKLR